MKWDAMNRLAKWTTGETSAEFWRYIYDAQNRRVAKYYVHYHEYAMLRDREAKLYCAADAWMRGEGTNPYLGAAVRSSRFSGSRSGGVLAGGAGQSSGFSLQNDNCSTTEGTEYTETVRGGAQVRSAGFSLSPSEECRGGGDWLDERATEALLERAGVLCHDPTYPVYEKQTFAYDGWRVIQEHKKTDGNGIPMATAIPVARQFTYGNYLDEALTVDADTDSDGDCIDSGGSTRYYYHQNSLFSVAALSDASADCEWDGITIKSWPDWMAKGEPRPSKERVTFTTWKHYGKASPLLPSGLLGPVTVRVGEVKDVRP
jgi:hypothetical protein